MILCVVFVVLMMFWLFGGYVAQGENFNFKVYGGSTLIPWLCVAILGYVIFNGGGLPSTTTLPR